MSINISVDSTGDAAQLNENFAVIPFHIILNKDSFEDGVNITPSSLLSFFDKTRQTAQTSAPSTGEYLDFFKALTENGDSLVHLCMSKELSAAYSNALRAKNMLTDRDIRLIDTRSLSGGIALLALTAQRAIDTGTDIDNVENLIKAAKNRLQVSFVINSTETLYRGGRCTSAQKFATQALSIKPMIGMSDGKLVVSKKFIGSFNSSVHKYIDFICSSARDNADTSYALLLYTEGTDEALVTQAKEQAENEGIFDKIYCYKAGCTVTAHCGRDTIGLLYCIKN
ncbi:MAG: DegV family protein [Clostridia bacterium]|nr:DegV family protein [Clostridia bacterium]